MPLKGSNFICLILERLLDITHVILEHHVDHRPFFFLFYFCRASNGKNPQLLKEVFFLFSMIVPSVSLFM